MPQAVAVAAAWVATAATAAAAAVGISTTMASALAIYSSVQAVATVALSVGAQVGLSALLSPKVGGAGGAGSQIDFQSNPDAGIPYLVGESGTAGVYIYNTVGEAKNRNLLFNSVLSWGPIEAFTGFKADGEAVTFGDLQQAVGGTYANRMWINQQVGATPSPPFGPPNTTDPGVLGEWTTAHKLSGLAASWYVLGYDQKTYASGAPAPMWKLKGVRAYDPRQDSTYPGGAGDQRWDDEDTWAWSDNPWIHALTWCIGRRQNGKRVLGLGCALAGIDVPAFVEAANVADANVWKVGGVVYSTDSKWEVLKAFCQAGGGRPIALGAKVSCLVNAPRVSIATLTGADIEGDPTITATQSRRTRVNAVVPRYRSEDHGWDIVAADPLVVADYVTADGGQRTQEIEYPLVQDVTQAAQLAAYAIVNSREFGPNVVSVTPAKGWALKPGDCVTIDEPELGLNGQKMLVVERERNLTTGGRILTCVSETDAKHDYCLGRTGTPPPTPGLTGVDITPEAPATDEWSVTAGLVDEHGSPTLIVTGACGDPNARWINVEYRLDGETEWTAWPGGPPTSTRFEITGLKPDTDYEVAVSYTSVLNILGDRRIYPVTTTGALPTPGGDGTPPGEPSNLSYSASLGTIFLSWDNPADLDVDKVEVWEATVNDRASATRVAAPSVMPDGSSSWSRTGLAAGATRYYWLRAVDKGGSVSGFYPAGATAGFAATTASLAIADFPADLEPVGVYATLPSPTGYTGPKTIRVAADGKLYRYVAGAWVTGVSAGDVSGVLSDGQISGLSAYKLTGAIVETQISSGAVTSPKVAAGAIVAGKIGAGAVAAAEVAAGTLTGDRLVAGTISSAYIATSAITSTKLASDSVVAGKIAAGVITADRLVVDTIETQYIKNNSLANAGIIDLSAHTFVGTSPYTNIGSSGLTFEVRGLGGGYTTVLMHLFVEFGNEDLVNQVGGWVDVVLTGAGYSAFPVTGGSILVEPGNPASLSVPLQFRTNGTGTITAAIGAWANLTGGSSHLYANRVKLAVQAIYKS